MLPMKNLDLVRELPITKFVGFEKLKNTGQVVGLFDQNGAFVSKLEGKGFLLLNQTPFFAEGGGQASDQGYLLKDNQKISLISMNKDLIHGYYFHEIKTLVEIKIGDSLEAIVDQEWRWNSSRNHSALHITWQANLNQLDHFVDEVGSKLNGDKYQLQLVNDPQLTPETAWLATKQVNELWIPKNIQANIFEITPEEAHEKKYLYEFTKIAPGEMVRMVEFPQIITEPCSGTHIRETKELEKVYFLNFERKAKSIVIDMTTNHKFAKSWFEEKLIIKVETLKTKMEQYPKINFNDLKTQLEELMNSWNYLSIQQVNQLTNEISLRINRYEKELAKQAIQELEATDWPAISVGDFLVFEFDNPQFTNKILLPHAIKQIKKFNQPIIFFNNHLDGANCLLIKPEANNLDLKLVATNLQKMTTFKGGGQQSLIQLVSSQPQSKIEWNSVINQ